jgi:hypothetical protein
MKLENMMNKSQLTQPLLIAAAIAFFMLLTRGSHVLTHVSLPDASLALFLLGGLLLKRWGWFAAFFVLATVIDFGAAAFDPAQGFCLTNGYWGLIPAYGAMWLGGLFLSKQDAFANKSFATYSLVSMLTTFVAFVISTQTYFSFSGRFPGQGVMEFMQYAWKYLPSWMGYSAMYFAIVWLGVYLFRQIKPKQVSNA